MAWYFPSFTFWALSTWECEVEGWGEKSVGGTKERVASGQNGQSPTVVASRLARGREPGRERNHNTHTDRQTEGRRCYLAESTLALLRDEPVLAHGPLSRTGAGCCLRRSPRSATHRVASGGRPAMSWSKVCAQSRRGCEQSAPWRGERLLARCGWLRYTPAS